MPMSPRIVGGHVFKNMKKHGPTQDVVVDESPTLDMRSAAAVPGPGGGAVPCGNVIQASQLNLALLARIDD
jgi:hypothetical protein